MAHVIVIVIIIESMIEAEMIFLFWFLFWNINILEGLFIIYEPVNTGRVHQHTQVSGTQTEIEHWSNQTLIENTL